MYVCMYLFLNYVCVSKVCDQTLEIIEEVFE